MIGLPKNYEKVQTERFCASFDIAMRNVAKLLDRAIMLENPTEFLKMANGVINKWWDDYWPIAQVLPGLGIGEFRDYPRTKEAANFKLVCYWQKKLLESEHARLFDTLNGKQSSYQAAIDALLPVKGDELIAIRTPL